MGYVPAVSGAAARSVQDHRPEVRGDMGCWEPAARHQVSVGRGAPRHRSGDFFRGGVAEPARDDAEAGRVWPFPSEDHIQATLALVECLLTGRIELQVWKRRSESRPAPIGSTRMGKRSCSFEVALRAHTLGGHERQRSTASTTHDLVLSHSHYLAADIASASAMPIPGARWNVRCYRS
jgi:hypothetical protein